MIFSKLKGIKAFESFHPMLLQQLCYYGYYENIDKGVTRNFVFADFEHFLIELTVFRVGDAGSNWYVCLSGSVDVVLPTENGKVEQF